MIATGSEVAWGNTQSTAQVSVTRSYFYKISVRRVEHAKWKPQTNETNDDKSFIIYLKDWEGSIVGILSAWKDSGACYPIIIDIWNIWDCIGTGNVKFFNDEVCQRIRIRPRLCGEDTILRWPPAGKSRYILLVILYVGLYHYTLKRLFHNFVTAHLYHFNRKRYIKRVKCVEVIIL